MRQNLITRINPVVLIIAVVLVSVFILYFPFVTNTIHYLGFDMPKKGMDYVYQGYDGLLYIVPAKSWYVPEQITQLRLEQPLPLEYYAAHLPVYPVFIALFAPMFGFIKSMIFVNILFSVFLAIFFYYLLKTFKLTVHPVALTIVMFFLPRFLIVRAIGAPETIFMFFVLTSIYFFEKKNYLLAGLLGGIATATKTPGILLAVAYGLVFIEQIVQHKTFSFKWFYILLIPAGLLGVYYLYLLQYKNFFAYFNTGGVVPMPYPFSAFNFQMKWVQTAWLEDIILYYFLYGFAVIRLKEIKYRSLFYFPLVFLVAATFVQHRDLSRYMIPLWPFALITYESFFTSKKFLILLLILMPAIYLYAWNFMLYNILPISDWRPFL